MLWNGLSLNTVPDEKYVWSPSYDTKPTQMESGFTLSFQRGRGPEEHLYAGSSRSFSTFQTSGGFSAGRSNSQLPGKGLIYSLFLLLVILLFCKSLVLKLSYMY